MFSKLLATTETEEVELRCNPSQITQEGSQTSCRVGSCSVRGNCCPNSSAVSCKVPVSEALQHAVNSTEEGSGEEMVMKCSGSQVRP